MMLDFPRIRQLRQEIQKKNKGKFKVNIKIDSRRLHVLAYTAGWTQWLYRSTFNGHETLNAEFWRETHDIIAPGDIVFVSGPEGAVQIQFDPHLIPRLMSTTNES